MNARTKRRRKHRAKLTKEERHNDFRRMIYQQQQHRERCQRRILDALPPELKAARLDSRRTPGVFYLITRETYPCQIAKGKLWRASRFDDRGPTSHFTAPDVETIVRSLTGQHTPALGPSYEGAGALHLTAVR